MAFRIFVYMNFRLIVLSSVLVACTQSPVNNSAISDTTSVHSALSFDSVSHDSSAPKPNTDEHSIINNDGDGMMQEYFVVVVDTSRNYFKLRNTMYDVSKKSGLIIDTLGRYYDPKRGIIVPDDSGDEIYAGTYFPRRFEGAELSIEYFNSYSDHSHTSNMALVAGQFTEAYSAQKQLRKMQKFYPNAFIIATKLYNGCMH